VLLILTVMLAALECTTAQTDIGKPMPWPVPDLPSKARQRTAAAAAAPLGGTCSNTVPPGYTFLSNTRTEGHGLSYTFISGTSQYAWQLLADACDSQPRCVSVGTNGWLYAAYPRKWPLAPIGGMNAGGWRPREYDLLCQGTLVKKGE
jgi:hypothetical protein